MPAESRKFEEEKRAVAEAAAELVPHGARVGLGTGSTVAYVLAALARRGLNITCVATSVATHHDAVTLGLHVEPFETIDALDIAIDGADQVDPSGWLIKGGGAAHTREKIVAAAAERFIVIASSDKAVTALEPPVPLELLSFGLAATLRAVAPASVRDVPPSPDGGIIADYHGGVEDPATLADLLSGTPGVVDHGLFAPRLVTEVLIAVRGGVERRILGAP